MGSRLRFAGMAKLLRSRKCNAVSAPNQLLSTRFPRCLLSPALAFMVAPGPSSIFGEFSLSIRIFVPYRFPVVVFDSSGMIFKTVYGLADTFFRFFFCSLAERRRTKVGSSPVGFVSQPVHFAFEPAKSLLASRERVIPLRA